MGVCSAGNCTNSHRKGSMLFRFPKDEPRRESWRQAVAFSRHQDDWKATDSSRICEVHFLPCHWEKPGRSLKSDAVPVKFCTCDPKPVKRNRAPKQQENDTASCQPLQSVKRSKGNQENEHVDHTYARLHPILSKEAVNKPNEACHLCCSNLSQNLHLEQVLEIANLKATVSALHQRLKQKEEDERNLLRVQELLLKAEEDCRRKRNDRWDSDSLRRGVQMRRACGSSEYSKSAEVLKLELPSIRTLQRRAKQIRLNSGLEGDVPQVLDENSC